MEEWRPIPGFERFYAVSSYGRVYRHSYPAKRGRQKPYYIVPKISMYGYNEVRLFSDMWKAHYRRVGRLVALAFIGPIPFDRAEVNHINGKKADDRLENLEYCSRSENELHSTRILGKNIGEKHWKAKLTVRQVRQIRLARSRGTLLPVLAKRYGVSTMAIWSVVNRKTWTHVT